MTGNRWVLQGPRRRLLPRGWPSPGYPPGAAPDLDPPPAGAFTRSFRPRKPPSARPKPLHQPAPRTNFPYDIADANEVTSGEHVGSPLPRKRGFPAPPRDTPGAPWPPSPRIAALVPTAGFRRYISPPIVARPCPGTR